MNRYRFANKFTAINTITPISINGFFARIKPTFAAVSCSAANPEGRIFPRFEFRHVFGVTPLRAESPTRNRLVLSLKPGLDFKFLTTISAFIHITLYGVHLPYLLAGKGVCWALSFSVFISYQMIVWHFSVLHMPFSATLITTKTSCFIPVGFYLKLFAAYFTDFCYHVIIIPQIVEYGTIEIDPTYFAIAERRIKEAQAHVPLPFGGAQ